MSFGVVGRVVGFVPIYSVLDGVSEIGVSQVEKLQFIDENVVGCWKKGGNTVYGS
ncbi:MAG: hypothetical protein PVG30_01340 [Gammaproteobacteria bacterium]|jgi:hypothetical protein